MAIVSDSNVAPLHARPLARALGVATDDCFEIPAGEASKTRAEWVRLTDAMLARGFGRDSIVIAVGGGVVGDLAGFVAATFMRGVPFIQVPTSLLAMIDAAIGGKTGVDTAAGKNLVGAFHHPVLVLEDPRALDTLPPAQLRNGLAEALKHALITSPTEFDWLLAHAQDIVRAAAPDHAARTELVERNVRIKAAVVSRDEREGGLRKTLNFGHTIGHAIETAAGFSMLHGECVAIGMRVEAMIAQALGIAGDSLVNRVEVALRALGLPAHPPSAMRAETVLAATRSDKKARAGAAEYALLRDIGSPAGAETAYGTPVADSVVLETLRRAFAE
jgi:3-dehydroquinate synthase